MAPSHPTILIGFGRYGWIFLRRLLQEGHERGLLAWDEPSKAEGPGARTLRDLALLWVSGEDVEEEESAGGLTQDLYSQIEEIAPDYHSKNSQHNLRSRLRDAAVAAKDRLLDASRRLAGTRLRLGLDVIVLAQPATPGAPGRLEDLLEPMMDALADDKSLERPAPGSHLLNFLLFLDFDGYWEGADSSNWLRKEVRASAERWHQRQLRRKPGFARIYLMDGQVKEQGRRQEALRIEEATILISLMIFGGQREHPGLRALFEREQDDASPVATFGIRAIERSRELMSLLSAAQFAAGWLEYLGGITATSGDLQGVIRSHLEPYRPELLNFSSERRELDELAAEGLREMKEELQTLAVSVANEPDWPERMSARAAVLATRLRSRLASWAGECTSRALESRLHDLAKRLDEIVKEALNDANQPLPLGWVIEELRELQRQLEAVETPQLGQEESSLRANLADVHREFRQFLTEQLNPTDLGHWWPLLAAVTSSAWTPVVLDAVNSLSPPDPLDPFLLRKGYELTLYLAQPWLVAAGLAGLGWMAGVWWFGPQMRKWLARGRLGWLHTDQGKLVDRVRSSSLAEPIESYAKYLYQTIMQRVRSEIRREIERVLERLRARRREMQWLRGEMREFLRTHGVDPDSPAPRLDTARNSGDGYRAVIESQADFERVVALNPSNPARYQSAQADIHPLRKWREAYCDTFVDPITFLEFLSTSYFDSLSSGGGDRQGLANANEIEDFLDRSGQFSLAFDWSTAPGVVADLQSWCVLPVSWRRMANISGVLANHAYPEQRVIDGSEPDRGYLLKVQWGVSPDRLTRYLPEQDGVLPTVAGV